MPTKKQQARGFMEGSTLKHSPPWYPKWLLKKARYFTKMSFVFQNCARNLSLLISVSLVNHNSNKGRDFVKTGDTACIMMVKGIQLEAYGCADRGCGSLPREWIEILGNGFVLPLKNWRQRPVLPGSQKGGSPTHESMWHMLAGLRKYLCLEIWPP